MELTLALITCLRGVLAAARLEQLSPELLPAARSAGRMQLERSAAIAEVLEDRLGIIQGQFLRVRCSEIAQVTFGSNPVLN